MRDKKSPSASSNASTISSSSVSSPSPPPPYVLSDVSSQSPLSTSFISMYSPSSRPLCSPAKTLYDNAQIIENCTKFSSSSSSSSFPTNLGRRGPFCKVSSSKKSGTSSKWVTNFLKLGKLSMEAEEGFLLQQRALEGLHEEGKFAEKPKKELRFAAKIAVAMDADGFIGVKNCVHADDAMIEVKRKMDTRYCVPSPSRKERPPSKQAHPQQKQRRRWKLFRRIRRTRVLFACLFQKVRKAFTSKRTLEAHDKFIK